MAEVITIIGIAGMPEVMPGDDLASLILQACSAQGTELMDDDVMVVTQKIVSKAEGRIVRLEDIVASPLAEELSRGTHRDPRHTEAILRESVRIVRSDRGIIISETRHGFVCANAGVDASNVPGESTLALLPLDPDASAAAIRKQVLATAGVELAVIISDTFGRPWREGATNVAIGIAGMEPLVDYRGRPDTHGQVLQTTVMAIADELACTAELVTGKVSGVPVATIRGYNYRTGESTIHPLIMPQARDLFR